jgi:uncharacterized protein (TIGR02594 family)
MTLATPSPPLPSLEYVVTASALRLRQSPALNANVLASLPRGTVVRVLSTDAGGAWSLVAPSKRTSAPRTGWMATKYLVSADHPTAPASPVEEFPWMPIALGEVGVTEIAGSPSNPRVVEYLRSTELDRELASDDSTPWCSAFVNWCVERAGLMGTNSAAAKSWLDWGRALKVPRRGCITVLSRTGGAHVGFFMGKSDITYGGVLGLSLLGGNQNDEVWTQSYDPARLLGYRVPDR